MPHEFPLSSVRWPAAPFTGTCQSRLAATVGRVPVGLQRTLLLVVLQP